MTETINYINKVTGEEKIVTRFLSRRMEQAAEKQNREK